MAGVKYLDSFQEYSGETPDELLSYPAQHQHDVLIRGFEEGIQRKAKRYGERSLSTEERLVLAVRALQREVNNGGYDQFLRNSSQRFAATIIGSLRRIGCNKIAGVSKRALGALSLPILNVKAINSAMRKTDEKRDELLEQCDRQFYNSTQDIGKHLYAFIQSHKAHFKF